MKHERETLEAVIEARNAAVTAEPGGRGEPRRPRRHEQPGAAPRAQLTGALGRLFALAEAYPDLKANQNMLALQEELTSTENKVAFARQAYNDAVMPYNTERETFPDSIVAGIPSFARGAALRGRDRRKEREAPRVSFS